MPSSLASARPAAAMLMALAGTCALASGFQLREQSPSAQGTSFAGISAGGDDIGGMFFNVATLTRFQGRELVAGFSRIQPSARLERWMDRRHHHGDVQHPVFLAGRQD